uniref:Uncharacterized protein n=1 Tax=Vitrella brassicaformis TaxID=1169539 RepID=A0A7S1K4B9_9ALVE
MHAIVELSTSTIKTVTNPRTLNRRKGIHALPLANTAQTDRHPHHTMPAGTPSSICLSVYFWSFPSLPHPSAKSASRAASCLVCDTCGEWSVSSSYTALLPSRSPVS